MVQTHNHSGRTYSGGNHNHSITQYHANFRHSGGATEGSTKWDGDGWFKQTTDHAGSHTHTFLTNKGGNHAHTINHTGNNHPHNNMPPYVLVYIMKII